MLKIITYCPPSLLAYQLIPWLHYQSALTTCQALTTHSRLSSYTSSVPKLIFQKSSYTPLHSHFTYQFQSQFPGVFPAALLGIAPTKLQFPQILHTQTLLSHLDLNRGPHSTWHINRFGVQREGEGCGIKQKSPRSGDWVTANEYWKGANKRNSSSAAPSLLSVTPSSPSSNTSLPCSSSTEKTAQASGAVLILHLKNVKQIWTAVEGERWQKKDVLLGSSNLSIVRSN